MGQALIRAAKADREAAYSQVNLKMYDFVKGSTDDGEFTANNEAANSGNTLRNSLGENYMTGFTPPFVEMGADYLFYHTLTKPSSSSFTSWEGTIVDPYYKLQAGRGYFMSMDVTNFDHADNIDPRWAHDNVKHTNRARGGFVFNRGIMEDYLRDNTVSGITDEDGSNSLIGFSRFAYDPTSSLIDNTGTEALGGRDRHLLMENEKFVLGDVTVYLTDGFNFLGNPFMAPISLNYLLGLEHYSPASRKTYPAVDDNDIIGTASSADRSELFGTGVFSSSEAYDPSQNTLRTKYWVINNATVKYSAADTWMHFKATYDYVSRDNGSTTMSIDANDYILTPDKYLIAPMQMFGLQTNKSFTITLSPELRTFGVTRYQKSAAASNSLLNDYLVVEVVSPIEKTLDRTAVVMRDGAKLSSDKDTYDTRKGISTDMETFVEVYNNKSTRTYPEPSTSIIYTKSSDGVNMLGNGVPMRTKELPLYVTPPATQQTMTMNFYNLENMVSVPNVWLIDKYENKTVKLTEGYSYQFSSGPSDLSDTENRFILRFWGEDEDVIGAEKEISCYYNTSILHISGLNQDDINSDVQVYDLQGRLIGRTKVNNAPSMEYLKPLSLGTYIVKITGKRNFTSKFVNLQN